MDLPGFNVAPAAREFLADFGETMLQVQLFEFTMIALVHAQDHDWSGADRAKNRRLAEWLFEHATAGQLRDRLKIADEDLEEELRHAVWLRNHIVHMWLIHSSLAINLGEREPHEEQAKLLVAAKSIRAATGRLQPLLDAALAAHGQDPTKWTPTRLRDALYGEDATEADGST